MNTNFLGRSSRTGVIVLCSILIGGCAVQTDRRGQLQFKVDNAEIFGQTVQVIDLPDGSQARVRVLDGVYSIKLQRYMRVIPIENAVSIKVRSTGVIDGRAVIVIDKAERNCAAKTQLISLKGAEVLSWDFGDCRNLPTVKFYSDSATFDFVYPGRTIRYSYQSARLMRNDYYGVPPGQPSSNAGAVNSEAQRYVPHLPSAPNGVYPSSRPAGSVSPNSNVATRSNQSSPRASSAPSTGPKSKPQPASHKTIPKPSVAMEFPNQEQKPVRIVLDE